MALPQYDTLPIGNRESNDSDSSKQITYCTQLTGAGRSAIAVIELWGASSTPCVQTLFRPGRPRPIDVSQVRYGVWRGAVPHESTEPPDRSPIAGESVVLVRTESDRYEIHCHGGDAAVQSILDDLVGLGVRRIAPGSLSGVSRIDAIDDPDDRLILEAADILARCTTARTAAIALDQVRGAMRQWRDRSAAWLRENPRNAHDIAAQARAISVAGRIGIRLTRPFDVVLAGPPNVGKSSLINAMLGYDRSITMDVAGTTRDVLDAETVYDGWPLRLRDTAGLHESDHEIERQGIERARQAIFSADLVVCVTEPDLPWDEHLLAGSVLDDIRIPILSVVNKFDLSRTAIPPPVPWSHTGRADVLTTVATTGVGIEQLLGAITDALHRDFPQPGAPVPINRRQLDWVLEIAALGETPDAMLQRLLDR